MTKILEFNIEGKLFEDVWNINWQFWEKTAKIEGHIFSPDDTQRSMLVNHPMTMMSYGEIYKLDFYRNPENPQKTKVLVTISLKHGEGLQWGVPNNLMKNWAIFLGTPPQAIENSKLLLWGLICGLPLLIVLAALIVWYFSLK